MSWTKRRLSCLYRVGCELDVNQLRVQILGQNVDNDVALCLVKGVLDGAHRFGRSNLGHLLL